MVGARGSRARFNRADERGRSSLPLARRKLV
jgi:hypothetical protein